MRIGYCKLGRTIQLDPARYGPQGDAEAPQLLERLARRNPDVEWWLIGKNTGEDAVTLPDNVTNVWPSGIPRASWLHSQGGYRCSFCKTDRDGLQLEFTCCDKAVTVRSYERYIIDLARDGYLDGLVIHAGQHGTTHVPIPEAGGSWHHTKRTNPQAWSRNYGAYIIETLNALGDRTNGKAPVAWIVTDPRNYLKARDIKWPMGYDRILSQHTFSRTGKHERFGDSRTPEELGFDAKSSRHNELWVANHSYENAGLELMIIPDDWETWGQRDFDERHTVGVASTSSYVPQREWRRSWLINEWVLKNFPEAEIYGRWDERSLADVTTGTEIKRNAVAEFPDLLGSWRTTISLPAIARSQDGILWSVAKPMQCFAARVACFLLGSVDAQGAVIPSRKRTKVAQQVDDGLWSIYDDWSDEELHLARWLRVNTPEEFTKRALAVSTSPETWRWLVTAQRNVLQRHWNRQRVETTIEERLGIAQ